MNSKYEIRPGDMHNLFGEHVGRRIVEAGNALQFADLPFAKDVGDWNLKGVFSWARFDDGAYWLSCDPDAVWGVFNPNPKPRDMYALRPITGP